MPSLVKRVYELGVETQPRVKSPHCSFLPSCCLTFWGGGGSRQYGVAKFCFTPPLMVPLFSRADARAGALPVPDGIPRFAASTYIGRHASRWAASALAAGVVDARGMGRTGSLAALIEKRVALEAALAAAANEAGVTVHDALAAARREHEEAMLARAMAGAADAVAAAAATAAEPPTAHAVPVLAIAARPRTLLPVWGGDAPEEEPPLETLAPAPVTAAAPLLPPTHCMADRRHVSPIVIGELPLPSVAPVHPRHITPAACILRGSRDAHDGLVRLLSVASPAHGSLITAMDDTSSWYAHPHFLVLHWVRGIDRGAPLLGVRIEAAPPVSLLQQPEGEGGAVWVSDESSMEELELDLGGGEVHCVALEACASDDAATATGARGDDHEEDEDDVLQLSF